jgi:molybdate transport system regulatory protein
MIIDASGNIEVGSQVHALLRPENIALSKTSTDSSVRNSLQGRVTEVWTLGALVRVKVDCGILLNALITRQSAEEMNNSSGSSGLCPIQGKFCPCAPVKGEISVKARTKLWFTEDGKTVMGAGRAELLKAIDEERSLRKACKKLGISYKHAWNMLKKMNEALDEPAIITVRGGKNQGTFLTDVGRKLLAEYDTGKQLINETIKDETAWENVSFKLSARNQLPGKVLDVEKSGLVCKITIEIEPSTMTSVVTREAAEKLDIKPGDRIYAVIKSTEVMVAKTASEKNK